MVMGRPKILKDIVKKSHIFTSKQARAIEASAKREKVTESALMRRLVDEYIAVKSKKESSNAH